MNQIGVENKTPSRPSIIYTSAIIRCNAARLSTIHRKRNIRHKTETKPVCDSSLYISQNRNHSHYSSLSDDGLVECDQDTDACTSNDTLIASGRGAANACHRLQVDQSTERHILCIDGISDKRLHNIEGERIKCIREPCMVAAWAAGQIEEVAEEERDEEASCSPKDGRLPEAAGEEEEEVWDVDWVWNVVDEWDSWNGEGIAVFQELWAKVVGFEEQGQRLNTDDCRE